MTEEIMKVSKKHCEGRVISVLEGGYNINSGVVSSFAQSVYTHVKFLNIGLKKNEELELKSKFKRKREFLTDRVNFKRSKKQKLLENDVLNNNDSTTEIEKKCMNTSGYVFRKRKNDRRNDEVLDKTIKMNEDSLHNTSFSEEKQRNDDNISSK